MYAGNKTLSRSPNTGHQPERSGVRDRIEALRARHDAQKSRNPNVRQDGLRAHIKDRMKSGELASVFRFRNDQPVRIESPRLSKNESISRVADRIGTERRQIDIAAIKRAREFVRGWSPKQVRPSTQQHYADMLDRMARTGKNPEQSAGTTRAYYGYRAALVHEARVELKESLTERDRATRTRDEAAKVRAEGRIGTALAILERYPPGERDHEKNLDRKSLYDGPRCSEHSNGKKEALASRPDDWRDRLWSEIRPMDRDAVAVLALTGARPAEFEKSVTVEHTVKELRFTILGAKLDDKTGRGQPARMITVSREEAGKSVEGRYLLQAIYKEKDVRIHGANAFTQRLERAGARAGVEGCPVSAYDFRHAFASRLKAEGGDRAEIAAALGHQAERSQAGYGSASLSGKSGSGRAKSASTSRPVRA